MLKKFFNKFIVLILAAFLALSFAACGASDTTPESTAPDTSGNPDSSPDSVNKNQFSGITLGDGQFEYDGQAHSLAVSGNVPAGTDIVYTGNNKTEVGTYTVTATLTNPDYITKELTATLTIYPKNDIAKSVLSSLFYKPDPWGFLPEALAPEKMAYAQTPVGGPDGFAADVRVSQIAKRSIGKQFYVLYEGLNDAVSVIGKLDTLISVGSAVADVYRTFINKNPSNYASFSGEAAGFKIKIELVGDRKLLLAGNSAVNIELSCDDATGTREGRVQLTGGIAVKYTSDADSLKFAVKTTVGGVGNLKQIEFVRKDGAVSGYLREFTGTATKNLKTTGVIASNSDVTLIMSNKRESDDLVISGYEEVYSSVTGEYLGGRVQETIKLVNYDTLWLHLSDVQGFNSVRVDDDENGLNADSVYINGQSTTFATKKVHPLIPTSSRRFDVEMKDVYYVVAETDGSKTEYKTVKSSIPMLFVQTEQTETFAADVKEKNSYMSGVVLPASKINTVNNYYDMMQELFNAIKDQVTYGDIVAYIGEKNSFFA